MLATGLRAEDLGTQSLFRVHFRSANDSGTFRLILKLENAERYVIETKDRFGRGLWRLDSVDSRTTLVDDRRRVFCESRDGVRIPEISLESLPLEQLPAILLGRLPGDLESVPGEGEYRDPSRRRWTVKADGYEPQSWTLWKDGEPWLWWLREAPTGEGVLSHRSGTQLRWKRTAGGPLADDLSGLELSPEYERVSCEAWNEAWAGTEGSTSR